MAFSRCRERGLQAAANPVAGDGVADLLRNCEAKARRAAVFRCRAFAHFDQKRGRRGAAASANGEEFRARFEGLQGRNSSLQNGRPRKGRRSRDKMREQRRLYHGRFRRAVSGFVGMQDVAIAHANIRAGNSLQRVHNDQCLQVRAETRRTGACGPSRDGGRELSGHQPSACAYGSRGAACERCGSVDTCASRNSPSK